jgi:acyl-coenzyme A thioesterase PaaI-like protein
MVRDQAQSCHPQPDGSHCVTCGDEAVAMVVLKLLTGSMAIVALDTTTTEVDITFVDGVEPGDQLLVHGGVALAKL